MNTVDLWYIIVMKLKDTLAAAIGSTIFIIGAGTVIIYSVISYNERSVILIPIVIGLIVAVIGWQITKYAYRSRNQGFLSIFLEAISKVI